MRWLVCDNCGETTPLGVAAGKDQWAKAVCECGGKFHPLKEKPLYTIDNPEKVYTLENHRHRTPAA